MRSLVPTCFFAAYQGLCNRQLMEMRGRVIRGRDFTLDRVAQPRADSRLKVAFLSAYFRDHTIGRLNIARLENLSREKIHLIVVYAGSPLIDYFLSSVGLESNFAAGCS